jgi:hypothetical protein
MHRCLFQVRVLAEPEVVEPVRETVPFRLQGRGVGPLCEDGRWEAVALELRAEPGVEWALDRRELLWL